MPQEIATHRDNGTARLVKRPAGCTPVGSHWVFHIKRTADGSIEWYKACLVAQEFWLGLVHLQSTCILSALFALVAANNL